MTKTAATINIALATATRMIREDRHDGLPFVAITAHAMADHRQRCMETGMRHCISKPVKAA